MRPQQEIKAMNMGIGKLLALAQKTSKGDMPLGMMQCLVAAAFLARAWGTTREELHEGLDHALNDIWQFRFYTPLSQYDPS